MNFDLTTPGFSLANARACALACQMAYECKPTVSTSLAQVLFIDTPNALCIAFRGTANVRAMLSDAECLPLVNGCHGGFWRSFGSVALDVSIEVSRRPPKPIILTGHSKGGAEVALCTDAFLYSYGLSVQSVYTFGQPRTMEHDRSFLISVGLGGRYFRIVNRLDLVPRAPLWPPFRHCGCEVLLTDSGLVVKPSLFRTLRMDAQAAIHIWRDRNELLIGAFNEHHIARYIEALSL